MATITFFYIVGTDPGAVWTNEANAFDGAINDQYATYDVPAGGDDENKRLEGTANQCGGIALGAITAVEIGITGYSETVDLDYKVRPIFTGGNGDVHAITDIPTVDDDIFHWVAVTGDTNAPSPWTWADVMNMDMYMWADNNDATKARMAYIDALGIRVTYTPGPSTVGTTTITSPFGFLCRKIFYANGRFWVFYCDGTDIVWRTSVDGYNWTAATQLKIGWNQGYLLHIHFDGTYVHYAAADERANGNPILYRMGTPDADGGITWSALEQTVLAGVANARFLRTCITVDSGGYPFISYVYDNAANLWYPFVIASDRNDGVWNTAAGFPNQLDAVHDLTWSTGIVALNDSRIYVVWARDAQVVEGALWSGVAWGGDETVTVYAIEVSSHMSITSIGDDVHFTYNRDTTNQIRHRRRKYGVGWMDEEMVLASSGSGTRPRNSADVQNGSVYCFWFDQPTANHVYYKARVNERWDQHPVDWINAGAAIYTLPATHREKFDTYLAAAYPVGAGSPYDIKHFHFVPRPYMPVQLLKDRGGDAREKLRFKRSLRPKMHDESKEK